MLVVKYKAEGAALKLLRDHVEQDSEATKRAYRIAIGLGCTPVLAEDRRNGRYVCALAPVSDAEPPSGWKRVGTGLGLFVPVETRVKLDLFGLRGPSVSGLTLSLFTGARIGDVCQYGQDIAGDWYIWGKSHWGPPLV